MKPERINQLIAVWEGWKREEQYDYTVFHPAYRAGEVEMMFSKDGEIKSLSEMPNYCSDLNAIHRAVMRLNYSSPYDYSTYHEKLIALTAISNAGQYGIYTSEATAAQRCEALLRTIGKWEEE